MKAIGIDLGTTGICGILMNAEDGRVLRSVTRPSEAFIPTDKPYEKIQDVEKIISIALGILDGFLEEYSDVGAIGITGQMHGIVYVNEEGMAVSPLYTWQDGRGNLPYKDGKSYSEYLGIPSGYGNLTHFYNKENGILPPDAKTYCTVHDYLAMRLCGNAAPILHVSDAASLGLFDMEKCSFSCDYAPSVTSGFDIIGSYRGIPVSVAIGDNQASVFGTVANEDDLLINVGTGSQVSVITDAPVTAEGVEARPYLGGKYLAVGAALCGGRAYSLLAGVFSELLCAAGCLGVEVYSAMDKLASAKSCTDLRVDTRFDGTRSDPSLRGSITNISVNNLTAGDLILGTVRGIIDELKGMYGKMGKSCVGIVGSGNGIRKNRFMVRAAEDAFGMRLRIPEYCEEAASGAAFFSMVAAGILPDKDAVGKLIRYKETKE